MYSETELYIGTGGGQHDIKSDLAEYNRWIEGYYEK